VHHLGASISPWLCFSESDSVTALHLRTKHNSSSRFLDKESSKKRLLWTKWWMVAIHQPSSLSMTPICSLYDDIYIHVNPTWFINHIYASVCVHTVHNHPIHVQYIHSVFIILHMYYLEHIAHFYIYSHTICMTQSVQFMTFICPALLSMSHGCCSLILCKRNSFWFMMMTLFSLQ